LTKLAIICQAQASCVPDKIGIWHLLSNRGTRTAHPYFLLLPVSAHV